MPHKDPEKRKQFQREYRLKNADKRKEYMYKYCRGLIDVTTEFKKNACPDIRLRQYRISQWKRRGIIFYDYDFLYELYIDASHCNLCNVKLSDKNDMNQKCLDHDHDITDDENVRYICCRKCNGILR